MEGFRVFNPEDWEPSGMDGTSYAAEDLKKCLEGLARHLFGIVEIEACLVPSKQAHLVGVFSTIK